MDKGKQLVKSESSGIFRIFKLWERKKATVEIIDMEQQFELFTKMFRNIKDRKFYAKSPYGGNKAFKHSSEIRVSCTDENQQISFNLVDETEICSLPFECIKYVHLGAVMIGVKGLQRSSPGAKAFVALYDRRFIHAEQGVIGTYEIDMSTTNGAIVYFCPQFPMDPNEFTNNIKVGIKTKGYELQRGADNIMITTAFIGNLCLDSPGSSCKINEEEMGKMLARKGIKAVLGGEYTALEWNLKTFFEQQA